MATDQTTHRPRDNASGARGGADDGTWRDRIVELHVLVEHGDANAAIAAQRWLATDGEARRVRSAIEEDCHRVRDDAQHS